MGEKSGENRTESSAILGFNVQEVLVLFILKPASLTIIHFFNNLANCLVIIYSLLNFSNIINPTNISITVKSEKSFLPGLQDCHGGHGLKVRQVLHAVPHTKNVLHRSRLD